MWFHRDCRFWSSWPLLICALSGVASAEPLLPSGHVYTYRFVTSNDPLFIDPVREIIVHGDYGVKARFCDSKSGYTCVFGPGLAFAVPHGVQEYPEEWSVMGARFKRAGDELHREYFGKYLSFVIVDLLQDSSEKQSEEVATRFYFSREYGLMAFEFNVTAPDRQMLVLVGERGFGSETATGGEEPHERAR